MKSRISSASGFTLLEVLIALIITVSAAAIVLTHIRTLMDYNRRVLQHQHQVTSLLNSTASFATLDFSHLKTDIQADYVDLINYSRNKVMARILNFSPSKAALPPIDQAYTPYQVYKISPTTRYSLILLQPGLKQEPNS